MASKISFECDSSNITHVILHAKIKGKHDFNNEHVDYIVECGVMMLFECLANWPSH